MEKEVIDFLVRDLCTGGQEELLRKYLDGGILSRHGELLLGDLFSGADQAALAPHPCFDRCFNRCLDRLEEDDRLKRNIEEWLARRLPQWSEYLYGVPLLSVPYADPEVVVDDADAYCWAICAELLLVREALRDHSEYTRTCLDKYTALLEELVDLAGQRSDCLCHRIRVQLQNADQPETVDLQEAVELSLYLYHAELVNFRLCMVLEITGKMRMSELSKFSACYQRDFQHQVTLLHSVGELYGRLWRGNLFPDVPYLLQPLLLVARDGAPDDDIFYSHLAYHLHGYTYSFFQERLTNPKVKRLAFRPAWYVEDEFLWHHLEYLRLRPDADVAFARHLLLGSFASVVLFSGRLESVLGRFGISPQEVRYLTHGDELTIYEWKTRIFIQIPPHLSAPVKGEWITRIVLQYQDALARLQLIKLEPNG